MTRSWLEIILIWIAVAIGAVARINFGSPTGAPLEAAFGAILAGSIATVSLLQLFRNNADGFVRKLVYVGGGSYLILALASAYIFVNG